MAWTIGTTIKEKWRIDSVLGEGGMATVYAATHRNGSRAALKLLHAEYARQEQVRKRFIREGYVANTVDHPGVVRVFDDDMTDEGEVFLVMELLEGTPLDVVCKKLGKKYLPANEVLAIADQILDVLAAAHAKQIVHRDIKPQNIFLTNSNTIKILDFGIARLRDGAHGATPIHPTMAGAFMGTPAFVPPEQARGRWELVDGRSDIWAVGATMYHLLTGALVHGNCTPSEQLVAAMTKPAPSLAILRPDLPRAIVEIVDRALAFERDNRWSRARSMQIAIQRAMDQSDVPTAKSIRGDHTIPLATQLWNRPNPIALRPGPSIEQSPDASIGLDSTTPDERLKSTPTAGPVSEDIVIPLPGGTHKISRKVVFISLVSACGFMILASMLIALSSPSSSSSSSSASSAPSSTSAPAIESAAPTIATEISPISSGVDPSLPSAAPEKPAEAPNLIDGVEPMPSAIPPASSVWSTNPQPIRRTIRINSPKKPHEIDLFGPQKKRVH